MYVTGRKPIAMNVDYLPETKRFADDTGVFLAPFVIANIAPGLVLM